MAAINEITFDDFINVKYIRYNDLIHKNTKLLFDTLNTNNKLLTPKQIDKYLTMVCSGKSRSLLNKAHGYDPITNKYISQSFILSYLTNKHLLTSKQVAKILGIINSHTEYTWIDNLINLGYQFTSNEIHSLSLLGYTNSIALIMNQPTATIEDLYSLCAIKDLSLDKITIFCTKYNIIPDNQCLSVLHRKIPFISSLDIIKILCLNKFVPNDDSIDVVLMCAVGSLSLEATKMIIDLGCKLNDTHITTVYRRFPGLQYMADSQLRFLCEFTKFAISHAIIPTFEQFMLTSVASHHKVILNIDEFYNIFFVTLKMKPSDTFCDNICSSGNFTLFSYLVEKNLFIITDNTLAYACKTANIMMIENLVNMKLSADKRCIENLNRYIHVTEKKKIIDLLLMAGLMIDYDILKTLYEINCTIAELTNYGLEYGDELYFMIHQSQSVTSNIINNNIQSASDYLNQFDSKLVNFRSTFALPGHNVDSIEKIITKTNYIPDQFCYDNSFLKEPVRSWLEKKYKLKPTIITLTRIEDFITRRTLSTHYFYNKTKYHLTNDVDQINNIYIKSEKIDK
jgi:hypothetical protein